MHYIKFKRIVDRAHIRGPDRRLGSMPGVARIGTTRDTPKTCRFWSATARLRERGGTPVKSQGKCIAAAVPGAYTGVCMNTAGQGYGE